MEIDVLSIMNLANNPKHESRTISTSGKGARWRKLCAQLG
jgi:hypothetical protein